MANTVAGPGSNGMVQPIARGLGILGRQDLNYVTILKLASKGTMRPLIFAPVQVSPTTEWMAYAKSIGVEPRGNWITFPIGVNA